MKDTDCVAFLQWALPQLRMRWPGFRKVRKQICKRIDRRWKQLGLLDVADYRRYLEANLGEWSMLDTLCRISISRFYRDRRVFDCLYRDVLPTLAEAAQCRAESELRIWCIGCASGEEVYTVKLAWHLEVQGSFPQLTCRFVATDADPHLLERAQAARYPASSLKELPVAWREKGFIQANDEYCLRAEIKAGVDFFQQDIRTEYPKEMFHLVLCRYLIFTYFDVSLQQQVLTQITRRLLPDGGLVIGKTESLPDATAGLRPWFLRHGIFRRVK